MDVHVPFLSKRMSLSDQAFYSHSSIEVVQYVRFSALVLVLLSEYFEAAAL